MKRLWAETLLWLVLGGCAVVVAVLFAPGCATYARLPVQEPPARYQGLAPIVYLQTTNTVQAECGLLGVVACAKPMPEGVAGPDWRIVTPNPCTYDETYARLVCHELAHASGWTKEHERK